VYALAYFEAPPERIGELERDVQISEMILRVLVLRDDDITAETVEKAMAAAPPPRAPERSADVWSPRGPGGGVGRDRFDRGPRRDREPMPVEAPAEGEGHGTGTATEEVEPTP